MTRTIQQNSISFFFFVAILILILGMGFSYNLYSRVLNTNANIISSYQTIRAANQSLISINQAALLIDEFSQENNAESVNKIQENIISALINVNALGSLVSDNSLQINLFKTLEPIINEKIILLNGIIAKYNTGQKQLAINILTTQKPLEYQIRNKMTQLIIDIKKEEIRQLSENTSYLFANKSLMHKLIFICLVLVQVFLLLGFLTLSNYFKKY